MKTIQVGGYKGLAETMWTMVDDEDFELASKYKWSQSRSKYTTYAVSNIRGSMLLHRLILGLDSDDERVVNHIDGNGLNNQRSNIEICSRLYNNQSINKPNSKIGCVYFDKKCRTKPWNGSISINKVRYQKYFATEEEARQFIADKLSNKNNNT